LKDIHEAKQYRGFYLALDQVINKHAQVDGLLGVGRGVYADVAVLINRE
jgi:hypothetical protein